MDVEEIQKMHRFKIYKSKKSLYERGIRYIKEGNVAKGLQTLRLLLDADPNHESAKNKLLQWDIRLANELIKETRRGVPRSRRIKAKKDASSRRNIV